MVPGEASAALAILQRNVGETLIAVYLHGSVVAGGLRPSSDVDLMAVIGAPMTHGVRTRLVNELMEVSGRHPFDPDGRRPLEVILFSRAGLAAPAFPAHCDFLYGEWLRERFEHGEVPQPHAGLEYTLLLAQARTQAEALIGPDPSALPPVIQPSDMRRAIRLALSALLSTLGGDERNVLLTLARMWRTLATGDLVPKDVAADWAVPRLRPEAAALMADARDAYLGIGPENWKGRQQEVRKVATELSERVAAML